MRRSDAKVVFAIPFTTECADRGAAVPLVRQSGACCGNRCSGQRSQASGSNFSGSPQSLPSELRHTVMQRFFSRRLGFSADGRTLLRI